MTGYESRQACRSPPMKLPAIFWSSSLPARARARSDVSRHNIYPTVALPQSHTLMVGKFMNIITKKYSLRHGCSNKVPFVGGRKLPNYYVMMLPAKLYVSTLGTKRTHLSDFSFRLLSRRIGSQRSPVLGLSLASFHNHATINPMPMAAARRPSSGIISSLPTKL